MSVTGSIATSSSAVVNSGGTLSTANLSKVPSSITVNSGGTLNLQVSSSTTVSSSMFSGAGNFLKSGSGNLLISALQAYTGATTVSAGTLTLSSSGSLANSSTTTVSSGATLKGTGNVGTLVMQGTLEPGNSIGTINILGDYTQSSGSTLNIEFNDLGDVSLVAITGNATIEQNTTLNVIPQSTSRRYTRDQTYTFMTTGGTLSGQFSGITVANTNLGNGSVQVIYGSNFAQFILTGESPSGCDVALFSMTADLANRANEIQLGILTEVQDQRLTEGFFCGRKGQKETYRNSEKLVRDGKVSYHPFFMVDYSKARLKDLPLQTKSKDIFKAAAGGVDFYVLPDFVFGFATGYTRGNIKSSNGCGEVQSNNYNLGLYFQYELANGIFIDGSTQGMKTYYELTRNDPVEGPACAKAHGYEVGSQLRFVVQKALSILRMRPFVAWNYYLQQVGNYLERRSILDTLVVGKDQFYSLELQLGLTVWLPIWLGRNHDWNIVPKLGFSFSQAVARNAHSVKAAFSHIPSRTSRTQIQKTSKDKWSFEAGLAAFIGSCSEVFFTYQGTFDPRFDNEQEYRIGSRFTF